MALENKERAKNFLIRVVQKLSSITKMVRDRYTFKLIRRMENLLRFLEVPKYIPEEIEKALDINVDELVRNRKDLPEVVLKSLYDDLEALLRAANNRIRDLEALVADLESQLAQVTSERDAEIERRIKR